MHVRHRYQAQATDCPRNPKKLQRLQPSPPALLTMSMRHRPRGLPRPSAEQDSHGKGPQGSLRHSGRMKSATTRATTAAMAPLLPLTQRGGRKVFGFFSLLLVSVLFFTVWYSPVVAEDDPPSKLPPNKKGKDKKGPGGGPGGSDEEDEGDKLVAPPPLARHKPTATREVCRTGKSLYLCMLWTSVRTRLRRELHD